MRAGTSAGRRFDELARAWRRRALRTVFLACSGLVVAFTVAGILASGSWKFWFGMLDGATLALYVALRDSPPSYIELFTFGRWRDELAKFRHFQGRRVDLFMRDVEVAPGTDPITAVNAWLAEARTRSQRAFLAKGVVIIEPARLRGVVAWPPDDPRTRSVPSPLPPGSRGP